MTHGDAGRGEFGMSPGPEPWLTRESGETVSGECKFHLKGQVVWWRLISFYNLRE